MLLNNKARAISFSGVLLAFNCLVFILINIIPSNTIFLMALASLFPSIIVIELGIKYSFIYSLASIILAFFIISNKGHFFTYCFLFSIYALSKALIEKNIEKRYLQYIVKLIYASIASSLVYYFYSLFLDYKAINADNFTILLLVLALLFIFLLYDYFFTLFTKYYHEKIRNKIIKK